MKYCWWILLCLVFSASASAQQPVITPDTPVDTATLHQWLHSGDPRLVAWAADFARRKHDAAILAEMPEWLEHWPIQPIAGSYKDMQRRASLSRPVLAVLDALIDENTQVPISTINAVAEDFPTQAVILVSRHPLSESRDTLTEWMWSGDRFLTRIATLIFAKDPLTGPPSHLGLTFVGGVVADSQSELWINVGAGPKAYPFREGGDIACGDGGGHPIEPGWPQIFTYRAVENDAHANGPVIVDLGNDRIASWRVAENRGWGTCYGVRGLNPYTRQRLIAYWLGTTPQDMTWTPFEPVTIPWTTEAEYRNRLGEIVEAQRLKLRATSDALRQRGILTGPDATPKLVVTIECNLHPCPLK